MKISPSEADTEIMNVFWWLSALSSQSSHKLYCPLPVVAPCKEGVGGLATEKLAWLLSWVSEHFGHYGHTPTSIYCLIEVINWPPGLWLYLYGQYFTHSP